MITLDELLMGREDEYKDDLNETVLKNLNKLLIILNKIRAAYGKPMTVSSGWRPARLNATVKGAAPKSNHIIGLACDFRDGSGTLDKWLSENQALLESLGAWQELPSETPGWAHIDIALRPMKTREGCLSRQFRP